MPSGKPTLIPFPVSSFPGATSQESSGRLVNCYAEPLGDPDRQTGPSSQVWRRSPGLSLFATTAEAGGAYRGGIFINAPSFVTSFEIWTSAYIVNAAGAYTILGQMPGTKKVSIARDQIQPQPDVVAVDIDNGAFLLTSNGEPTAPTPHPGFGAISGTPNSVCFEDGYFFYTFKDCRCFASVLNDVGHVNSLTFITCQAKSDVTLLRGIAYSGLLWLFTTGHCEIWQDAATAAPSFPYSRAVVIEYGLIQPNAIAGWETGFSELVWVAQDFGVYHCPPGVTTPTKVSPPDLERLIEAQVHAGNTLEASCYIFAGKKFWCLSSPAWSWEFNIGTQKWNERWSVQASGSYGRWRVTGGHPAYGKWLAGDMQSGNLLWIDSTNYTENGAPQLMRMESGPVEDFPNQVRIARADFDFVSGVGVEVASTTTPVTATGAGTGGVVRLGVGGTANMSTGDSANISGVRGTTEANGTFTITVIDGTHIELQGTAYVNAYVAGGTVTDVTSPANAKSPSVSISLSKDGGQRWGNPLVRALGTQGRTQRMRASVKSMGLSGPMGCRWRLDVTDPVYTAFLKGTQSSDPREVGA